MVRRYIQFRTKRKTERASSNRVILVSMCEIPEVTHCFAELVPRFAKYMGSGIAAFRFGPKQPDSLTKAIYQSFGARLDLQESKDLELRDRAKRRAEEIFVRINSKQDVVKIQEQGIPLGDLIYDTYLRDLLLPTIDIRDKRLLHYIYDALLYLYTCEQYFTKNSVKAVFVDHLVYIWQGVLLRFAMRRNIPLYTIYFNPRLEAQRIDLLPRAEGMDVPCRFNYWRYPAIFARLRPDEQEVARRKGAAILEQRLFAERQDNILGGQSAFGEGQSMRVLPDNPTPKILILLHDFCDACHVYRGLLFDDFYEWIHFLLKQALETPFEWYVKPHPNTNDYRRRGIANANDKVLQELRQMYPSIGFLPPDVSNRQLIKEGITAVFTMYGTAAHEFPYLGVPSVCASDNPHVAYNFTVTPKSITEYTELIRKANNPPSVLDQRQISEFCYMNFLYAGERLGAETGAFDPMPSSGESRDKVWEAAMRASTSHSAAILDNYVMNIVRNKAPSCLM